MRAHVVVIAALGAALLVGIGSVARGQNNWGIMDLGPASKNNQAGGAQANKQAQQLKQQQQQQKNKECAEKANNQNLRGDQRQRFLRDCLASN